ncbi:hypothetical protein D3C87_1107020 [compost metagenome]
MSSQPAAGVVGERFLKLADAILFQVPTLQQAIDLPGVFLGARKLPRQRQRTQNFAALIVVLEFGHLGGVRTQVAGGGFAELAQAVVLECDLKLALVGIFDPAKGIVGIAGLQPADAVLYDLSTRELSALHGTGVKGVPGHSLFIHPTLAF